MSHYVKFTYQRARADIAPFDALAELNACRRKLLEQRLMGVDSNGVGFGNLSVRDGVSRNFYITGSATGGLPELTPTDCVPSRGVRFRKELAPLRRRCDSFIGIVDACRDLRIRSIDLCGHSLSRLGFVATLLDRAPTTSKAVAYGTPEMAYEIMRLFKGSDLRSRKIFVMAGHEGGIVTFGKNLEDAFDVLMRERRESSPCI